MDETAKCVGVTAPSYPDGYLERQKAEMDHFRAQTRLINAQAAAIEAALAHEVKPA